MGPTERRIINSQAGNTPLGQPGRNSNINESHKQNSILHLIISLIGTFLVALLQCATERTLLLVCPSVGVSVRPSVRPSVVVSECPSAVTH